ncbi:MAG TPA: GGDEF domain-containing protein [Anaerohalosphaeraceae bacterium]|nr:GGDEF domain-containing protein [Anaerohalosphaeraceae bacterium]HOL89120.1 GGDEF domain-containing protein [Anaerohalosphaeraceae bacterium]HPP57388.1 GGDEF domain-containing protein [Anaerohalosphaeraceae bacterium]
MENSPPKILLIGLPQKAMMNPDSLNGAAVCESILGGIEQAQSASFETIAVVLSCIQGHPQEALKALRKSSPQSRILLLAEMLEEPIARELTGHGNQREAIADDYLICPVRAEELIPSPPAKPVAQPLTPERERYYQERIRQLEKLATEDDLTGLKNRRYLNQFLAQVLALARQYQFPVTLLLFDIDNFKQYNDQFGHWVGDKVLVEAGEMIRRCCRSHDVVARIGGDEFAVVFWDLPEKQRSSAGAGPGEERRHHPAKHPREPLFMAERFRKEISASRLKMLGPEGQGRLTISGGLASFPEDGKTADELLKRADEALLEAKRQGKNQIVIIGSKTNASRPSAESDILPPVSYSKEEKASPTSEPGKPHPAADSKKQSGHSKRSESSRHSPGRKKL